MDWIGYPQEDLNQVSMFFFLAFFNLQTFLLLSLAGKSRFFFLVTAS